jgi:hypothetical protein
MSKEISFNNFDNYNCMTLATKALLFIPYVTNVRSRSIGLGSLNRPSECGLHFLPI